MRTWRAWLLRAAALLGRRSRRDREFADELEAHLQAHIDDNRRAGMTASEARREALLRLGGLEQTKEQHRDRRGVPLVDAALQDVRYALRILRKNPGFSTVAVLTLALGIGATTAIFTALNAVLLKPLPVPDAHELFVVYEAAPEEAADLGGRPGQLLRFSYPRFERLERALGSDGTLAALSRPTRLTLRLSGGDVASTAQGQLVSRRYFETFAVLPAHGRAFADDGAVSSESAVAVISHRLWQARFGGAFDVLGREVIVNEAPITIVGIAPPAFTGTWLETPVDVWLPISMQHVVRYRGNASFQNSDGDQPWMPQAGIEWLNIVGRAAPDRLAAIEAQLNAANRPGLLELAGIIGDTDRQERLLAHTLELGPFASGFSGLRDQSGRSLFLLTALAVLVLLIVCSNVANLLLALGIGRQRETGVRIALGATRSRLIGQCLTESLVLAAIGGGLGLLIAGWGSALLARAVLNVSSDVVSSAFVPDVRVVGFAALLSLGTAVVFGVLPALRAGRAVLQGAMARTQVSTTPRSVGGMHALVAAQLALSFVAVTTAGLFGRSLLNLSRLDLGFDREQLVTIAMDPVVSGYTPEQVQPLYDRLRAAVVAVPGVVSAAVSTCGLVSGCEDTSGHQFEGYQPAPGENVRARDNFVGPGYLATVGMPLVAGRELNERDTSNSPRVAVVNESLARRYFGGESPVGRRVGWGSLDTEIVGVVRDARVTRLRQAPVPMVYRPIDQFDRIARAFDVRVAANPQRSAAAIREVISRQEPRLLLTRVVPMDQYLYNSMTRDRGIAYLIAAFGLLALFLACVGLYGVMSFAIARRTHELGVRLAVGATPADLIRLIVGGGLRVMVAGTALGAAVAVAAARFIEVLLFGTSAVDPLTYAAAIAALVATTLIACYVPARRAARLDPVAALRCE